MVDSIGSLVFGVCGCFSYNLPLDRPSKEASITKLAYKTKEKMKEGRKK